MTSSSPSLNSATLPTSGSGVHHSTTANSTQGGGGAAADKTTTVRYRGKRYD